MMENKMYSLNPLSNPDYLDELLSDPFYFDDDQFKKKPQPSHIQGLDFNDAIPDEEFEKAEQYAKVSPYVKKGVPDDIEKVTLQLFAHLYELANQTKSEEGEDWDAILKGHSPSPKKHSLSQSTRFLQYESNFSDDSYIDYIPQPENSLSNLLNAVSEIFLGTRFDYEEKQKTAFEMDDTLKKDQITWKNLRVHYSDYFQTKMSHVFCLARNLLKERIEGDETALYYRIAFYAGAVISIVGMVLNQKFAFISGLSISLIASSYMIVRYATTSLNRMQQESDLKLSIDNIYYEAAKHRLNLNNPNPYLPETDS